MGAYGRRAIKIIIGICCVVIAGVLIFFIIRQSGKRNLQENIVESRLVEDTEEQTQTEKQIELGQTEQIIIDYEGRKYQYRNDIVNILCIGVDKEEVMWERDDDGGSVGQSDAILLVSLDFDENKIRVLAVPRDTMVSILAYDVDGNSIGGFEGQLALQYAYADGQELSCQLVIEQVGEIFHQQVPINGYAALNMSCIDTINDAVGGVTVTMDEDYRVLNPTFEKGATIHLEGYEATQYVQGRDITVAGSAYGRIGRQKQYLKAFVEQAKMAMKADMTLPVALMRELSDYMLTDLTTDEVVYLATEVMECTFTEDDMQILPGEIIMGKKYEEYYLNEEAVQEIIIDMFYEEI